VTRFVHSHAHMGQVSSAPGREQRYLPVVKRGLPSENHRASQTVVLGQGRMPKVCKKLSITSVARTPRSAPKAVLCAVSWRSYSLDFDDGWLGTASPATAVGRLVPNRGPPHAHALPQCRPTAVGPSSAASRASSMPTHGGRAVGPQPPSSAGTRAPLVPIVIR
jgi:hypothetical protein